VGRTNRFVSRQPPTISCAARTTNATSIANGSTSRLENRLLMRVGMSAMLAIPGKRLESSWQGSSKARPALVNDVREAESGRLGA